MKFILFLVLSFSVNSYAFNLTETWNESSYGEFVNSPSKKISFNAGYGGYQNQVRVNANDTLKTTNNGFYLIGVKLNKAKFSLHIPYLSGSETRQSRGNTQFTAYGLTIQATEHITFAFDHYSIKGLYYESSADKNVVYQFPNLANSETSLIAYYSFEPNHRSFSADPLVYEKEKDSASWMLISKLSSFEVRGLNQLTYVGELNLSSELNSAQAYSLEASLGYSKNVFWDHWFLGGSFGVGLSYNIIKTQNVMDVEKEENIFGSASFVSFSFGYIWENSKLGTFAQAKNSFIKIKEIDLGNNTGQAGTYYGYSF